MTTMEERFRQRPLEEKIEALTKECDALALCVDQWKVDFHELSLERDALAAAAKLALDALYAYESSVKKFGLLFGTGAQAITALRQAGVQ